jgi:serine/threonine protein kinase
MPQTGQILHDRYQLKEKLGQNASRQTWLAADLGTNPPEPVIVKLLALSPQMQWDGYKLFEREAQVLQNLNHPRIPKYRDYFAIENQPNERSPWFGLVQNYIPGVSLQQLLNEGKHFTQEQVIEIARDVLKILVYLHELNPPVLHRDIKPSNLIWAKDSQVYLVDFGAVQDQAAVEGATFTVVGTYGYVPMEQFGGRAVPASDLYALGATLIHLITGVAPANLPTCDSRLQFADQVAIDQGLVNWIGKLTEPALYERISTARQALRSLETRHTLSPPVTSHKPTGSRIQLNKSSSQLEIKIPRRGFQALSTLYLLGSSAGILLQLPSLLKPHADFFTYLFGGLMLLVLIILLLPAFIETDLSFNREYLKISWKLFGLCYWRRRVQISKVSRIYEQEAKGSKGVTIQVGAKKYTSNPLSEVERLWIIQEVRDWLGIKTMKRINGVPKTLPAKEQIVG